ncbi:MAG: lipid-A-disaccharide synthase [Cyanobacteria bacterium P01_G01_bin.54]
MGWFLGRAEAMNIFISTGEVSGDLQAAALIEALLGRAQQQHVDLKITGIGGQRMAQAGAELIANSTGIAAFGLQEALPMILPALRMERQVKQYLRQNPPDLFIFIDYEGFNTNMGRFCQKQFPHLPIVYYITPQIWVYSPFPGTAQRLSQMSDRILAIFPAEARFFRQYTAAVTWVGHPLVDRMAKAPTRAAARQVLAIEPDETAIALLPASRPQEIKLLLPTIFAAAQQLQAKIPGITFWIPLSSPSFKPAIQAAIAAYQLNATLVEQDSRQVLAAVDLAIAKCGTVSLELALLNVPQVVLYRLAPLTMWAARYIFRAKVPFIAPPNLLLMEEIVPELIQEAASVDNIVHESLEMLQNPERQAQIQRDYQRVHQEIGEPGVCDRAAAEIFQLLAQRGKVSNE